MHTFTYSPNTNFIMRSSSVACVLIVCSALLFLDSCKDDPKPIAGISFELESEETTESDGTVKSLHPDINKGTGREIKVKLLLDKAAPDNITITYTVGGTAAKKTDTSTGELYDFLINGSSAKDTETLVIQGGSTEAVIALTVFEDYSYEFDEDYNMFETIVLTLESVASGSGQLGELKKTYTLKILEDDALVVLEWDATPETPSAEPDHGDVDMDLFAWIDGEIANGSAYKDTDAEYMIIPAGFPDGTYQLSYTYYAGTSDNLKFTSYMFARSLNNKSYLYGTDNPLPFSGTYKLVNKNTYPDLNNPTVQTVQDLIKSKTNFTTSGLKAIPLSGSRTTELSGQMININENTRLKLNRIFN
jgi:hypothetical protein